MCSSDLDQELPRRAERGGAALLGHYAAQVRCGGEIGAHDVLELLQAGPQQMELRALEIRGKSVMDVRRVTLTLQVE